MPQSPKVIEHPSTHWSDRAGEVIRAIVGHGTVGTNSLAYLTKNARKVSIPYLIARNGDIFHMVPDDKAANHAGAATSTLTLNGVVYRGGEVNQVTTGFELESLQRGDDDDYTEAQLLSMGWLINDMRRRHGRIPLFRHAMLDPIRRSDPVGLSVPQMEAWAVRAAAHFAPPIAPLYAAEIGGPNGRAWRCSAAAKAFYDAHKGVALLGLVLADERATVGQDGRPCSVLPCERAIIKTATEGPHLALLDEAVSEGWIV